MNLTFLEIKEKLIDLYDPDDIVEALELSTEDLVNAFEEKLTANLWKFSEEFEDE